MRGGVWIVEIVGAVRFLVGHKDILPHDFIFRRFIVEWTGSRKVCKKCQSGEIGNRTRLKIVRRKVCGFESHLWHILEKEKAAKRDFF